MKRTKLGLLVLCAVMLGVTALSTSAAQASLYTWLVLDAGGTALESLKAELLSEVDSKDLTLLTHVSGLAVAITCTNLKLSGIYLETEGKLTTGGRAFFEKCEAYGKGTLEDPLNCKLHSAGTGAGTIETGQLKGELVLHTLAGGGTELLTAVEPKEGTTFATILTEGCALPEANTINGKLFIKDSEKKAETHSAKHLIESGPLTSLWIGTDTKEHLETSVDGSIWTSVSGAHKGLSWGGKHKVLQVVAGLKWLVLDAGGTALESLKAELVAETDSTHLTLLTEMFGLKMALTCTGVTFKGVFLEAGGKLTEGGKAVFTGCDAYKDTALGENLGCTVKSPGAAAGTLETNEFKGELILHILPDGEKEVLVRIEPKGTDFITFRFEECALTEVNPVRGVIYLKDAEGFATTHKVKHLLTESASTALYLGSHTVGKLEKTKLDASIWVKLAGAHEGLAWSGMDP